MNLKEKAFKIFSMVSEKRVVDKKSLLTSYVSLFLAIIVLITTTFSWFTLKDGATVDSDTFTMNSASGLRVNEGESITNHITIKNFKLDEASSVDGRNMYFPNSDSLDGNTGNMIFREASVGDKSQRFVYKDFTLRGDSATTYVYIKSYTITVGDQVFDGSTKIEYENGIPVRQVKKEECPVRISFITDSGTTPLLLDPTAIVEEHVKNYNAVSCTSITGSPVTQLTDADSFSDYYFVCGSPIFTLDGTEPLDVTMVVWLEGTGNNCDNYINDEISVDIELESNWSDMETVTFVDDTIGDDDTNVKHWINSVDDPCIVTMCYKDLSTNKYKTVVMSPYGTSKTQWMAPIPKNVVTDISFYRYSLTDEIIYNAWHTKVGVNGEMNTDISGWLEGALQENREKSDGTRHMVYTARRGNGYGKVSEDDDELEKKRLSPCIGYWGYTGSGSGGSTDTPVIDPNKACSLGLYVNIPDEISWMRTDLGSSGNYDMYVIYGDDNTRKKMSYDNGRCSLSTSVDYGTIIKSFVLVNRHDSTEKDLPVNKQFTVLSDYNVTYDVGDNGHKAYCQN